MKRKKDAYVYNKKFFPPPPRKSISGIHIVVYTFLCEYVNTFTYVWWQRDHPKRFIFHTRFTFYGPFISQLRKQNSHFSRKLLVLLSILMLTRTLNFYKYALQIYLEFSGNVPTILQRNKNHVFSILYRINKKRRI